MLESVDYMVAGHSNLPPMHHYIIILGNQFEIKKYILFIIYVDG